MKRFVMTMACVLVMAAGNDLMAKESCMDGTAADASAEMNFFSHKSASRRIGVKYFSQIDIKGSVDVVFTQTNGGKPVVTLYGDKDAFGGIVVESDGKILSVGRNSNQIGQHLFGSGDVKVYVSAPDLTAVRIFGSGDFEADGKVDTDNLLIDVKGSGDVEMKNLVAQRNADIIVKGSGDVEVNFARTGHVSCSVTGSGDVELKGYVKSLKKQMKGSGEIKATKLKKW